MLNLISCHLAVTLHMIIICLIKINMVEPIIVFHDYLFSPTLKRRKSIPKLLTLDIHEQKKVHLFYLKIKIKVKIALITLQTTESCQAWNPRTIPLMSRSSSVLGPILCTLLFISPHRYSGVFRSMD